MMEIRAATIQDMAWIKSIWPEKQFGWFERTWNNYWKSKNGRWLVIEPYAFVHYSLRRDGVNYVQEIAVDETQRKQGYGRALLEHIGIPITLKTDCDNVASNAFYRRLGFIPAAKTISKSGKAMMIYEKR